MQNQTITELYSNDNKSKYSSNPNGIIKNQRDTKETNSKAATAKFLTKISNKKKISNEQL